MPKIIGVLFMTNKILYRKQVKKWNLVSNWINIEGWNRKKNSLNREKWKTQANLNDLPKPSLIFKTRNSWYPGPEFN
jgi:hypothetical protein